MAQRSVDYVFGGQQSELDRLLGQAEDLRPETSWLLAQLGIQPGWRAADIGCGPIGVLDMLSEHVGPTGQVVGIEREPRFAAMARNEVARRHLPNTTIVEGDILDTSVERGSFDLVHERLVLINVPPANQHAIVAAMATLARPGGILALESWDRASYVCHPEPESWRVLNQAYRDLVRSTNGDGTSGRTLPSLLRAAGITDIEVKVHVRAVKVGEPRRTHRLGLLDVTKSRIVAAGLMSEAEFDARRSDLAARLADPDMLLIDQLFVQSWGRKPA